MLIITITGKVMSKGIGITEQINKRIAIDDINRFIEDHEVFIQYHINAIKD